MSVVRSELGITQSAVSQHLKVLRDAGVALSTAAGNRRIYALTPHAFAEVDAWLRPVRRRVEDRSLAASRELPQPEMLEKGASFRFGLLQNDGRSSTSPSPGIRTSTLTPFERC